MTSATERHTGARRSDTHPEDVRSDDDIVEIERDDDFNIEDVTDRPDNQADASEPERPKTPAYISPIGKIGPIPPISSGIPVSANGRIELPYIVGAYLTGKKVDEYGDIVDDKTGQPLARAGGDLPSIVGRAVSNSKGDILGDDGELLGYVADVDISQRSRGTGASGSPEGVRPRSLVELMGMGTASLMVDHTGNILDGSGNVVGKFHDNNNPLHRKEKEEQAAKEQAASSRTQHKAQSHTPPNTSEEKPQPQSSQEEKPRPRRSESERRQNAESWRKENPEESPSDIFLDVKSTTEGIQLTIRIPTVFQNQHVRPNICFS